jgi:ADP-ribose pyrophosphatase
MAVETRHALVHGIREIHLGKVFRLVQEDLTLPNGFRTSLEVVRHPGASAIVALSGNGEVLLLHQYRHAVGEFIWEIPAGTLKDKEEPIQCAKRELVEETGYEAMEMKELGQMVPVPGYSDERIHIFLATQLRPANQNLDRDEVIAVHSVPFHRSFEMIRNGEIKDAKTIVGLTLAKMALAETG